MPAIPTALRSLRRTTAVLVGLALATPVEGIRADVRTESASGEFIVVVNATNPMTDIDRDKLSKIFLKRATTWPSGKVIQPVDLPIEDESRGAFSRLVLHKSITAVRAYWQQQIFSGRDVPPAEKATDSEVLGAIKLDPTAIGYVSPSATLPAGVRRITVSGIDE